MGGRVERAVARIGTVNMRVRLDAAVMFKIERAWLKPKAVATIVTSAAAWAGVSRRAARGGAPGKDERWRLQGASCPCRAGRGVTRLLIQHRHSVAPRPVTRTHARKRARA